MPQSYTSGTNSTSSSCSDERANDQNKSFIRTKPQRSSLAEGVWSKRITPGLSNSRNHFDSTNTSQSGTERLRNRILAASTSKNTSTSASISGQQSSQSDKSPAALKSRSNSPRPSMNAPTSSTPISRQQSSPPDNLRATSKPPSSSSPLPSKIAPTPAPISRKQSSPPEVTLTSTPKVEPISNYPSIFYLIGQEDGESEKFTEKIGRAFVEISRSKNAISMAEALKKRVDGNKSEVNFASYDYGAGGVDCVALPNALRRFLKTHRSRSEKAPLCIVISGRSTYHNEHGICSFGLGNRSIQIPRLFASFTSVVDQASVTIISAFPYGSETEGNIDRVNNFSKCFGYNTEEDSEYTIQEWVMKTIAEKYEEMPITGESPW